MSMRVADSQTYLTDAEKGGCWRRKSGLEQKLIIFSVVLGLACLGLIIGLAVVVNNKDDTATTPSTTTTSTEGPTVKPNVCESELCQETAKFYQANMNLSADPCNNFFDYVCGGYLGNNEIPPEKSSWGVFNELRFDLSKVCTGKLQENILTTDPRDAFYNARKFYQTCAVKESYYKADASNILDHLKEILQTVTGSAQIIDIVDDVPGTPGTEPTDGTTQATTLSPDSGTEVVTKVDPTTVPPMVHPTTVPPMVHPTTVPPMVHPTTVPPETTPLSIVEPAEPVESKSYSAASTTVSWSQMVSKASNTYGLNFVVVVQVGADISDTKKNVIYIDQQSSFPVGRLTLINDSSPTDQNKMAAYKNYIKETICFYDPNQCLAPQLSDLLRNIEEIVDFERKLAMSTRSPVERRDASTWYKPMTIADLQSTLDDRVGVRVNWLQFIKDVVEGSDYEFNETTIVIVKELDYLEKVLADLKNDKEETIMKNYIRARLIQSMAPPLSQQFRDIQFQFDKVVSGQKAQTSIEEYCFGLTNNYFDHVVGRLYVDAVNFTESTKDDMESMVKHLADAFRTLVDSNDWMDNPTKEAAKKKLEVMDSKIGYPDWTLNDTNLNEYFEMGYNMTDNFFDNLKEALTFSVQKTLAKLNKENNRTEDWVSPASIVNAFYSPSGNGITFPAGILQVPFYQEKRLKALNYGGIGYVIGHEITHGFDDQGRQYDPDGNYVDWWSAETLTKFNERKQCFIDQYSNIKDAETGLNLIGAQIIGENIADNGGIREAYQAYVKSDREESRLPGIDLDDRQLFFVGAGSVWCTKYHKEALEQQILYGVHSPSMYRATIPLRNTQEFGEVFNCPDGSYMKPEAKDQCTIW